MQIPDEYPDALIDELAPYGFEFDSVSEDEDGEIVVLFQAEPESFVRANPGLGIEDSYGDTWPPDRLALWLRFDRHGDPVQVEFEVFDLLASTASMDPELHARLNTMEDPFVHAAAVGEALGAVLRQEPPPADDYME